MDRRTSISRKLRFDILKRDDFRCQYCGASHKTKQLEVDHIIPISKGGYSNLDNLTTSCVDCNQGKSNRVEAENSCLHRQKQELEKIYERKRPNYVVACVLSEKLTSKFNIVKLHNKKNITEIIERLIDDCRYFEAIIETAIDKAKTRGDFNRRLKSGIPKSSDGEVLRWSGFQLTTS